MRLITQKGQLALPVNFEFTVEQNSPIFSDDGAFTIPTTIPATLDTLTKLGNPTRLSGLNNFLRKIPALLEAGVYQRSGQLIIDEVSMQNGISSSFAIAESDVYSSYKDKNIRELLKDVILIDFTNTDNPVRSLANYLMLIYRDSANLDYTLFPIALDMQDKNGTTKYSINNAPDMDSFPINGFKNLKWQSRTELDGDKLIKVPDGYGISPFFYLHRFIKILFQAIGYNVRINNLTASPFNKIVLINNTADTICKGKLYAADMSPSCTFSDFLEFLKCKFNAYAFVYPESKSVDILMLSPILKSNYDLDINNRINGGISFKYEDNKHVVLTSDTSLDGAEPAAETIFELHKKYPMINNLDENEFFALNYDSKFIVFRKALGRYYEISGTEKKHLGTNYFKYDSKYNEKEERYESKDLCPPMILYSNIVMPFVGDRAHLHTQYNASKIDSNQDIIVALDAGLAGKGNYRLGTTQKYNDMGNQWIEEPLTYEGLYSTCWKAWDRLLINGLISVSAKIDYKITDLLKYSCSAPKWFEGNRFLPKFISYNIGNILSNNNGEYLLIKNGELSPPEMPVFSELLYKWVKKTDYYDILASFDNEPQAKDVWGEFEDTDDDDYSSTFPSPVELGVVMYSYQRYFTLYIKELYTQKITTSRESCTVWYESVSR